MTTPNFLVIGAQKAGTTALCSLLDTHPDIFLSRPKEPMFFSRDDSMIHPFFFVQERDRWASFNWQQERDRLIEDYEAFFSHVPDGAICGEGSTTYLPSRLAPQRVLDVIPDAKLIVSLRDPVARIYSSYWYHVRIGIPIHGFKRFLTYESLNLLYLGEYATQIRNWFRHFPRHQFHFIIFERFRKKAQLVIDDLCDFLGVSRRIDVAANHDMNAAIVPRLPRLQLALNLSKRLVGQDLSAVPGALPTPRSPLWRLARKAQDWCWRWNMTETSYPPMPPEIKRHLTGYYQRVNSGLSELIGVDVDQYWFSD